ncbi:MAG: protease inhibitor I42 family protein [Planctomycetes bacterium]|nr:protease inhibitor I42 family protein [Planctomycetota bacterium]
MECRRLMAVAAALVLTGSGVLMSGADATAEPAEAVRNQKIGYQVSGGLTGRATDLKVYDNGDAVWMNAMAGESSARTLRLAATEYAALVGLFEQHGFAEMPNRFPRPSGSIADAQSVTVAFMTGRFRKLVNYRTGDRESAGFRALRAQLAELSQRVATDGTPVGGAAGLEGSISVQQVGTQVQLAFTVRNRAGEPVELEQRHQGHWFELEAWTGGRKVWTWSEGRIFPMVAARPLGLLSGESRIARAEWEFTQASGLRPGESASFTFKAYTLRPEVSAAKTVELGWPLTAPGAAPATLVVDDTMDGRTLDLNVGDTLEIRLAGNPTTGYEWNAVRYSRSLPVSSSQYVPTADGGVGGGGVYTFAIKPDPFAAGSTHSFKFAYSRAGARRALKTFKLTVRVSQGAAGAKVAPSGPGINDALTGNR